MIDDSIVDIGMNYDWSQGFFDRKRAQDTMAGEIYIDHLKKQYYESDDQSVLAIP